MVPLIVHWPQGILASMRGAWVRELGFLPDIVETCLEVAGGQRPETIEGKPTPKVDGRSFLPLLKGRKAAQRGPVCVEHEGNRLVREGKWKLVGFFDESWELYDLENDPSELKNLAQTKPEVVKRLASAYDAWTARVGVRPWSEAQHYSVYPADSKIGARK